MLGKMDSKFEVFTPNSQILIALHETWKAGRPLVLVSVPNFAKISQRP